MKFFFDTNVCIGYIFKWDPWHIKANSIFNKNKELYWSETVEKECREVFNRLKNEYISFLDNLKNKLLAHNKYILYEKDLLKIGKTIPVGKNKNKKDIINKFKIISSIWEEKGWYEEQKNHLIKFLKNYH
ncbi:MAG: hypothetical protein LBU40_01420 [Methanobrevibacter sp.]|jgi:predicted nucleic acid-binding protein|nr:hypothetical protein [Methanobrevibacter sp.]